MPSHDERPEWLRHAVGSALAQEGCSIELIVVDDGSAVPVEDVLADFDDPRLRVLRVEHRGGYEARNVATAAARAEYLRFIDSDDVFPRDSTAILLGLATTAPGRVIACGATRWCRADLSRVWDWPAGCPRDASRSYLLQRCAPFLPSLLFPARVAAAAGPWDTRFRACGDWDFILRAFENAEVVETRRVTAWYRQHRSSQSKDPAAFWEGTCLGVRKYFERHPEERGGRLERQARSMLDVLAADIARPRFPWADARFWRALARDPTTLRLIAKGQLEPRIRRTWTRLRRG